jgi:hypothetical protein
MHTDNETIPYGVARNYTAKRFLPLALLRLKTWRPDLEAMRTRKP